MLAAGVASVVYPVTSPLVLGAVTGWLLWFAGAAMLGVSILIGRRGAVAASILASLFAMAGGGYLWLNPAAGALAAAILVAAVLILDGAFEIVLALDLRPSRVWRWLIASATASALAGIWLAAGGSASPKFLAWGLGASLLTSGAAVLGLSYPLRGKRQPMRNRAKSASLSAIAPST